MKKIKIKFKKYKNSNKTREGFVGGILKSK